MNWFPIDDGTPGDIAKKLGLITVGLVIGYLTVLYLLGRLTWVGVKRFRSR